MSVGFGDDVDSRRRAKASDGETRAQSIETEVLQIVVTWGVQHAMSSGYRTLTGREEPTARDRRAAPTRDGLGWRVSCRGGGVEGTRGPLGAASLTRSHGTSACR